VAPLQPWLQSVSNGRANAEREGGSRNRERLGRRIGIALFWLLCCYVIGMSTRSIVPALFWPHLAPLAQMPGAAECARELRDLDDQLLRKAGESLALGEVAAFEQWLIGWDRRFAALTGGCGSLARPRRDLLTLRSGLGSLFEQFGRGPLRAHDRLKSALDPLLRAATSNTGARPTN
jgi:hypothetical protein